MRHGTALAFALYSKFECIFANVLQATFRTYNAIYTIRKKRWQALPCPHTGTVTTATCTSPACSLSALPPFKDKRYLLEVVWGEWIPLCARARVTNADCCKKRPSSVCHERGASQRPCAATSRRLASPNNEQRLACGKRHWALAGNGPRCTVHPLANVRLCPTSKMEQGGTLCTSLAGRLEGTRVRACAKDKKKDRVEHRARQRSTPLYPDTGPIFTPGHGGQCGPGRP